MDYPSQNNSNSENVPSYEAADETLAVATTPHTGPAPNPSLSPNKGKYTSYARNAENYASTYDFNKDDPIYDSELIEDVVYEPPSRYSGAFPAPATGQPGQSYKPAPAPPKHSEPYIHTESVVEEQVSYPGGLVDEDIIANTYQVNGFNVN